MLFSPQALGWNKEKFSIIGHSYGAVMGIMVSVFLKDQHQ
jgi:predicted alpha/beta superfamily hydrolase